jgi:hypothetical protein
MKMLVGVAVGASGGPRTETDFMGRRIEIDGQGRRIDAVTRLPI